MATSDVDICSAALVECGAQPIQALSESTVCAQRYPAFKKFCLSIHPWRFNTGKRQLARLTATPLNQWKYAFSLPSDLLQGPLAVFNSDKEGAPPTTSFEQYENTIYADDEELWIDYQFEVAEGRFPPPFEQFLIKAFAAEICIPVTEQRERADDLRAEAWGPKSDNMNGGLFGKAKRLSGAVRPTQALPRGAFPLTAVR